MLFPFKRKFKFRKVGQNQMRCLTVFYCFIVLEQNGPCLLDIINQTLNLGISSLELALAASRGPTISKLVPLSKLQSKYGLHCLSWSNIIKTMKTPHICHFTSQIIYSHFISMFLWMFLLALWCHLLVSVYCLYHFYGHLCAI